jgi:hypothetical protein
MRHERCLLLICVLYLTGTSIHAETASALFARGFTVMPEPQRVTLGPDDFEFSSGWRLEPGSGVSSDTVTTLKEELSERHQIRLQGDSPAAGVLLLEMIPGAVTPGASQDSDHAAIAAQAYKMELAPARVRIVANADAGLFYGVETFVQLLQRRNGHYWLPKGEIVDWPDLQMRQIYWDDAHHLERLPELKRTLRQAAFFKINGVVIKLEGHFQFQSAAPMVEPQALSPAELQELTDYGLRYHVQLIPYLDAPAHIAFILKHPEYASLRAFPDSNYEMCVTNPDALKMMFGLYDDLLAANKGVNYFYLSTDEAYYVGLANNSGCQEALRAQQLGSVGKVLSGFVTKAAGYLHDRGRTVVFWGEYPLKPDDIASLPPFVINGETDGEKFDPLYKARGIRQMIYNSTEGEEKLFPQYFSGDDRINSALSQIDADSARQNSDLMGLVIAGWGDMGLHPETFWLGYATITSAGWKRWSGGTHEASSTFYPLFYGPSVVQADRIYRLMSEQAQIWTDSWETVASKARTPIWGDSNVIFHTAHAAHDQTLRFPGLQFSADKMANAIAGNDELQALIGENIRLAAFNRYNLEVFLSIARLCRQNLEMLRSLKRIEDAFQQASLLARAGKVHESLAAMDAALAEARAIRLARNAVLRDTTETWYKSWMPRVEEANGRRFLHQVDDVKDHLPDRTVDMTYLVYRELQLPLEDWYRRTQLERNQFAAAHHLAAQSIPLDWKSVQ